MEKTSREEHTVVQASSHDQWPPPPLHACIPYPHTLCLCYPYHYYSCPWSWLEFATIKLVLFNNCDHSTTSSTLPSAYKEHIFTQSRPHNPSRFSPSIIPTSKVHPTKSAFTLFYQPHIKPHTAAAPPKTETSRIKSQRRRSSKKIKSSSTLLDSLVWNNSHTHHHPALCALCYQPIPSSLLHHDDDEMARRDQKTNPFVNHNANSHKH